jgi:hypothetical protein
MGAYMESAVLFPRARVATLLGWNFAGSVDNIATDYEYAARWRINDGTPWTWTFDASTEAIHIVAWVETGVISGNPRAGSMYSTGDTGVQPVTVDATDGLVLGLSFDDQATAPSGFGDFAVLDGAFVQLQDAVSLSAYVYDGAAPDALFEASPALRFFWRDAVRPRGRWFLGKVGWSSSSATCTVTVHASSTGNTYESPRTRIGLDDGSLSNPCGLSDVSVANPASATSQLWIPEGDYSGASAMIEWGDASPADVLLWIEATVGGSTLGSDQVLAASSGQELSVGSFTVPAGGGRAYIEAAFPGASGFHTIDPATFLTITKTG